MKLAALTSLAFTAALLTACGSAETGYQYQIKTAAGEVIGEIKLTDLSENGTKVEIELNGLEQGPRAMHFHEFGKCEGPDFKSAGGHYNPTGVPHGTKMEGGPHAGDMMNIMIGADGAGTLELINERVSIKAGGPLPALMDADGSALIIHAKADDYKSQPSGAAGPRIGCVVIGK